MATRSDKIDIAVDEETIVGTLVTPATKIPGVLFAHGWGGNQEQYLARAREVAALGCLCLTFNFRGHAETEPRHNTVTREDNLRDLMAAYDLLAGQRAVDPSAIAVVGSSYGGYLAAILTSLRPVRWLGLRVPALYKDQGWHVPKASLDRQELAAYRQSHIKPEDNRALGACAAFKGDVLLVECGNDTVIPHPTIANYRAAFENAHSLTYRVIEGADHGLSEEPWQQAYTSLLVTWATEMVLGARESGAAPEVQTHLRPSPRRRRPTPA